MYRLERLFRPLTWACVVLLAVLSLTPGDYMVRTGAPGDLEHFVAYLGTGVIACLGYARRFGYFVSAVLLCGYAGVLEVGQIWAPGRHPDFIDFASSSVGVIAGMLLAWAWNSISSSFYPRTRT
jgi:VanZ family protein